mgnify:CR=1 FL=1
MACGSALQNSARLSRNGSNWRFSRRGVGWDVGLGWVVGRVRVMCRVCCDYLGWRLSQDCLYIFRGYIARVEWPLQCVDEVVGVRPDSFDRDGSVKLELARCAARNC